MKSEVYSWRLAADLKSDLEREARRRKMPMSAALDLAARDWLSKAREQGQGDEEEQRRLHRTAASLLGAFAGTDPGRSEDVRSLVRRGLRHKNER